MNNVPVLEFGTDPHAHIRRVKMDKEETVCAIQLVL